MSTVKELETAIKNTKAVLAFLEAALAAAKGSATKGSKKGSAKEEVAKPAKKKSAFEIFCEAKEANVQAKNKDASKKAIKTILKEMWENSAEKTKKQYTNLAEKDKERFQEEMDAIKKEMEEEKPKGKGKAKKEEEKPKGKGKAKTEEETALLARMEKAMEKGDGTYYNVDTGRGVTIKDGEKPKGKQLEMSWYEEEGMRICGLDEDKLKELLKAAGHAKATPKWGEGAPEEEEEEEGEGDEEDSDGEEEEEGKEDSDGEEEEDGDE
jgi:upstream-binding transcription factor